ncbi:MAG: GxxExxY protein [Thiohalobacterales bacterium]|nr:GxxExxY protein [Thiohalobacterales bacterium]
MIANKLSGALVDASREVQSILGPGLLESVYEEALVHELRKRRLAIARQATLAIAYKSLVIRDAFRVDLLVEKKVIVELKAVETVTNVHKKQLLTYLKLSGYKLGLLINFNTDLIKNGITRMVNGL